MTKLSLNYQSQLAKSLLPFFQAVTMAFQESTGCCEGVPTGSVSSHNRICLQAFLESLHKPLTPSPGDRCSIVYPQWNLSPPARTPRHSLGSSSLHQLETAVQWLRRTLARAPKLPVFCMKYPHDSGGTQKLNLGLQGMMLQVLKGGSRELIAQLACKIVCYCLGVPHPIREWIA